MLELAPTPAAGLYADANGDVPVPLLGVTVDAEITGLCARVSVAHRYANREDTPIEAVYVFPLDEGAAVCGFEAIVDGVRIVGEVLERDKAFERYDEAMERGDGAFLLDEERPDVFQASIGNLPPGKEVLVRLTYVTELPVDAGRLRFTLPTTIAPRYAPAADRQAVGRSDAEALNPPHEWTVPYGLDLTVRLAMPGGVSAVASPSHAVSLAFEAGRAIVTLTTAEAALDRDFVLTADASVLKTPQAWTEDHDGERAIAVAFTPDFDAASAPAEVVFVVDRSGSMGGDSIAEVRNALQLCLRSLVPGCRFNIVGFGDTYVSLFPESRPYDQASLDEATRHVETIDAELGGTELEPALRFVLEQPTCDGLPRQVVVLTDGEVTNTDAVIALAARHRSRVRVFAFGIGAAASQHLVRGLARSGGGTAEFIHPRERIEGKVLRLFGRLLSPALTDVRLEWIGGEVAGAPGSLPPIFAAQRLLTYGIVRDASTLPTAVRLSATGVSGPLTWEVPVPAPPVSGSIVTTLAARARIRELEEGADWIAGRGSRQRDRKASAARQQIIDLAVRHGLMSRETSYVAIERRETPVHGEMRLRRVPVALASGWGGLQAPAHGRSARFSMAVPAPQGQGFWNFPSLQSAAPADGTPPVVVRARAMSASTLEASGQLQSSVPRLIRRMVGRVSGPGAVRPPQLDAIVALQAADGSWDLSDAFALAVNEPLSAVEQSLPASLRSHADARRLWATALALAWLAAHASSWQDEWRLLGDKARRWLDAHAPGGSAPLLASAAAVTRP